MSNSAPAAAACAGLSEDSVARRRLLAARARRHVALCALHLSSKYYLREYFRRGGVRRAILYHGSRLLININLLARGDNRRRHSLRRTVVGGELSYSA